MYSAVAGLKAHMSKLNVIGNNVANANTFGFKSGSVTFMESLYTSMRSGSDGTATLGGSNPAQVGYGCKIGTIDLDMSTKNYVPTGVGLDCMINGDGFLMVGDKNPTGDKINPESLELTRVGRLAFDNDGYLVDTNGKVVYGFTTMAAGGDDGTLPTEPSTTAGKASTRLVPIRLPLADSKGNAVYPFPDGATGGAHSYGTYADLTGACIKKNSASIDKTGQITVVNEATGDPVVVGYVALGSVDNPNGVTHIEGPYYKAMGGAGDLSIVSIGGVVSGVLNNGQAYTGEDEPPTESILTGSKTELVPNGLESSGTDIATEFSEMITTQRGYQANTRIITVTDSMLEELVNMKR